MGFNLKEQLVFYGAYHNNPTNVKIHMACVPLIMGTAFVFGSHTPSLSTPPSLSRLSLPLNLTTLVATGYSALYIILSPNLAGASMSPFVMGAAALANRLIARFDKTKVTSIAAGIHVVSWILQFVGHGKYEGRKPALLDNIAQALFLAPLFVWYEVLFKLGFYKRLREEVESGVEVELAKLKARKGQ